MTSKEYFTAAPALVANTTTKAGLFYRWDKEEEERRRKAEEREGLREQHEGEDGKKATGSSDVQSVASLPYASTSRSPTFREKAAGFVQKGKGRLMGDQDDVAYGSALMRGASRSEAEAAAQAARDEQEAKFEAGVAKAKELNPKAGTYWSDRPGPMGMASFQ